MIKADIETCIDTFKIGYETYEESKELAEKTWEYFHNRQYDEAQLSVLSNRGQPPETFNIIRLFTRMILGYYTTVINTTVVKPVSLEDAETAVILNDLVNYIYRDNNFKTEIEKLRLDALISGLMCSYVQVVDTGRTDQFGRQLKKVEVSHIPSDELILDPMSRLDDYSDARFIHRYKWVTDSQIVQLFGKQALENLEPYNNFTDNPLAEYENIFGDRYNGKYDTYNNYLVVHTILIDDNDESWSIYWSNDQILSKEKITYKEVKFPYRVTKVNYSRKAEYYGLYKDILETQNAVNQALIKIQLMVNTQKAFVAESAVEDIEEFTRAFNKVNAVIPVQDLAGIRIENMTQQVADQYLIIDKAFERIQRVLGINDSFLGMAYASDSGRKVKLQQSASIAALQHITSKFDLHHRLLTWDMINLIKQYYTSHQVVRISDQALGDRWIELNAPMQMPTGAVDPVTGEPEMYIPLEEYINPETGETEEDEYGNLKMVPINERNTEVLFTNVDLEITTAAYNNEDERNQVILDQTLNGNIGQLLSQINPVGYFKVAGLSVMNTKTRYSQDISRVFTETSNMLAQSQMAQQQASQMAQGNPDASSQLPGIAPEEGQ